MKSRFAKILFDRKDHELIKLVQEVLSREASRKNFKDLLNPYLTPHGIKEMAASQGFRIAYAMANLLHSLEIGKADDRLNALRALHDEVLNITHSSLRRNTARVLLQIVKELVRVRGDYERQLELAHDFRVAMSGKPRLIREELRRYHLLEMPEAWNQIAFDDHVHDANTKGRKTPTHLIMDAWIKGIRRLTVIYYNFVPPEATSELLDAGEIMGITIRIGVSTGAQFRGRNIRFIWVPRGFSDAGDFLSFLAEPTVRAFMDEGRQVSEYQKNHVIAGLNEFNRKHRTAILETFGVELQRLESTDFLAFVGSGQASILHLAEFIHTHLLPLMEIRVSELRNRYVEASGEERERMEALVARMRELDSEAIVEQYLRPVRNPSLPDPNRGHDAASCQTGDMMPHRVPTMMPHRVPVADVPPLLRLAPHELMLKIDQLHSGYRICLNLSDLRVEEVLEMLYDCKGMITHLEIFNLKDHVAGKTIHYKEISELQTALNEGNVIMLKKLIRGMIQRLEEADEGDTLRQGVPDRIAKLTEILRNIPVLQSHYSVVPLKANIGSDSTGRSQHQYGMGLIIRETLPPRAQRAIRQTRFPVDFILPVRMTAYPRTTYLPDDPSGAINPWLRRLRLLPGLRRLGERRVRDWEIQENATRLETPGNIIPLGGLHEEGGNELYLVPKKPRVYQGRTWRYLNSGVKNAAKVLIGLIPAFLTFALTKEWWLLAYGGAFIWFGITGLRNILQSVLGGGGFRRSPLLRWNDYVSWGRLTDSLLFTGFSVPLLDYLVKSVILDRTFGITTATNPTLLYTFIALANGLYLSSHNTFRGLPKGAILGNFFRSILSIPLAVAFNTAIGGILFESGFQGINDTLQKWAAIISKAASDCVAGVIEGLADRYENLRMRERDYTAKIGQLFDTYARLELLFPEKDVLEMLESPKQFIRTIGAGAQDLERIIIINALDLLYFWMYQPHARSVLAARIRTMSDEERQIFVRSQCILQREREISQLFLDGIIGRNFSRGLAFYLDRYREYLESLRRMVFQEPSAQTTVTLKK
ncbi:MAG: hypothetical protein KKD68_03755 [Proteobacteria bacterium]|nr:hypothetical protein [Pseudomonadota bacterium]